MDGSEVAFRLGAIFMLLFITCESQSDNSTINSTAIQERTPEIIYHPLYYPAMGPALSDDESTPLPANQTGSGVISIISPPNEPGINNTYPWLMPQPDYSNDEDESSFSEIWSKSLNESSLFSRSFVPAGPGSMPRPGLIPQPPMIYHYIRYQVVLLQVHAILMVIAFTFFLPVGMMFGRYFKGHWPNTTLFGSRMWFHLHRIFLLFGIGCSIAAFAVIFAREQWQWVGPKATRPARYNLRWPQIHAMLGLLACCLTWAQPLNAVFRCAPGSGFRWMFAVFHGFFGFAAFALGCAAITIATIYFRPVFLNHSAAFGVYIAFLAVTAAAIVIFEILQLRLWSRQRKNVAAMDREVRRPDGSRHITLSMTTSATHKIMTFLFLLYVLACIAATVAITVLIGLKRPFRHLRPYLPMLP